MFMEPLIDSVAHLRHIFSHLLLSEKLDVHPVHLAFFAIEDERNCAKSEPPHSISGSLKTRKVLENQGLLCWGAILLPHDGIIV